MESFASGKWRVERWELIALFISLMLEIYGVLIIIYRRDFLIAKEYRI